MLAAQSTAVTRAPVLKSLAASFVAIPLHANPQPAQKIVSPAMLRFDRAQRVGQQRERADRDQHDGDLPRRGGLRWCWRERTARLRGRRPRSRRRTRTRSGRVSRSSMRSPATISTSSPAASAGWTTTSGARISATTCSGKPRIDMPVPSSQRPRRTSRQASARRRCVSSGASLASIAWNATPRLYSVDAPMAATIPRTSSPMSNDHRSRAPWIAGAAAAAAYGAYALPGARRSMAAAAPPARRRGPHAQPSGLCAHLRRRPARAGHASRARGPRARAHARDLLPRRRAGPPQPLAAARDPRRRSRRSRCTATVIATCCASRPSQVREDIARAEDAIADRDRDRADAVPPAVRRAQRDRARARAAAAAGARCCGATGDATGSRRRRPRRSQRCSPTAPARGRCCCCTTPTTTRRPAHGATRSPRCRR